MFTDIFAVVAKSRNGGYKLCMYCDESVPPFGPTLPDPPEFKVSVFTVSPPTNDRLPLFKQSTFSAWKINIIETKV